MIYIHASTDNIPYLGPIYQAGKKLCAICGSPACIIGHNEFTNDIRKIHWCGDCWEIYIHLDLSLDYNLTTGERFSYLKAQILERQQKLSLVRSEPSYNYIKQLNYECGNFVEISRFSPGYLKGIAKSVSYFGNGYNSESDFYISLTNFMGGFGLSKFLFGYITSLYISSYSALKLEKSRKKNQSRQRSNIRRSVNTNISGCKGSSVFLTLTFDRDIGEKQASKELNKFMKRLNYHNPFSRYIWVKERTVKGRIHYHLIIFDWSYFLQRDIQSIWGQGYVWIEKIKNVRNVGSYISKYLGKSIDFERNSKMYYISRKCLRYKVRSYSSWVKNPSGKVIKYYDNLNCKFRQNSNYKALATRLYKSTTILLN